MIRTIAIANQKGGVGKTTTAVNLAASLAAHHRRVLLVDVDPQGNATMGAGVNKNALETSVYTVLLGEASMLDARVRAKGDFDLIPANRELAGAEIEMVSMPDRETKLKDAIHTLKAAIAAVADQYDYILIDCPPTLNLLTLNALCAADSVLIPMQCEYYALEGLSDLVQTLRKMQQHLNPSLEIEGLLRTMYDPRISLSQQVAAQLEQHFGSKLFATIIPRNVRLAEAPSHGLPVLLLDKASKGSMAYMQLAAELLTKHEAIEAQPATVA
jgi:chromosome partitioning protein